MPGGGTRFATALQPMEEPIEARGEAKGLEITHEVGAGGAEVGPIAVLLGTGAVDGPADAVLVGALASARAGLGLPVVTCPSPLR